MLIVGIATRLLLSMIWRACFILALVLVLLSRDVGAGKPQAFARPEFQAARIWLLDAVEKLRAEFRAMRVTGSEETHGDVKR